METSEQVEEQSQLVNKFRETAQKSRKEGAWERIYQKLPKDSGDFISAILGNTLRAYSVDFDQDSLNNLADQYDELRLLSGLDPNDRDIDHEGLIKFFLQEKGVVPKKGGTKDFTVPLRRLLSHRISRRRALGLMGLSVAGTLLAATGFSASQSTASEKPRPPASPTIPPRPVPTEKPKENINKELEGKKLLEFLLKDTLEIVKNMRRTRFETDPGFRDRVNKEFADQESINLLFLGLDSTRMRPQQFNYEGRGNADLIMLVSINPKTGKVLKISIPRDLYEPRLRQLDKNVENSRINIISDAEGGQAFNFSQAVIEDLTGLPVDGVIKMNVDTFRGFKDRKDANRDGEIVTIPSFIDTLFPLGIEVTVPQPVYDPEFMYSADKDSVIIAPSLNGGIDQVFDMDQMDEESIRQEVDKRVGKEKGAQIYKTLRRDLKGKVQDILILPGNHRFNGEQATVYARTRKADSTTMRQTRESDILESTAIQFLKEIILGGGTSIVSGQGLLGELNRRIDNLVSNLEIQQRYGNLFSSPELDLIKIVRSIQTRINSINLMDLTNRIPELKELLDNRRHLMGRLVLTAESNQPGSVLEYYGEFHLSKPAGVSHDPSPNQFGNYKDSYYMPTRAAVSKFFKEA